MIKKFTLVSILGLLILACGLTNPTGLPSATETPAPSTQPSAETAPTATQLLPTAASTSIPTTVPDLPIATSGPLVLGPENFPAGISPLTGLAASDPEFLNRRPVSVKVQIFPRQQRPVWGVMQADIVYDYYQNTGMTRFHAIFYANNAEQVGPIRSGRLFDQHLVRMYKSFLAFGGADRRILQVFLNSNFADRLIFEGANNCPAMCRTDPNGYNFLMANTAELTNYVLKKGLDNSPQNLDGMSFNEIAPAGGQPLTQLFVRFSISAYTRWDYDAASGRYLRFQDTTEASQAQSEVYAPMIDGLNGQQISTANLVVIYLPHLYAFKTQPGLNEIIDIQMSGSALAYAMRDGQIYEVRWNRPKDSSVLFLTFPDGQIFPFKPGNTWIEVIGQSSKLELPAPGVWRFQHSMP